MLINKWGGVNEAFLIHLQPNVHLLTLCLLR